MTASGLKAIRENNENKAIETDGQIHWIISIVRLSAFVWALEKVFVLIQIKVNQIRCNANIVNYYYKLTNSDRWWRPQTMHSFWSFLFCSIHIESYKNPSTIIWNINHLLIIIKAIWTQFTWIHQNEIYSGFCCCSVRRSNCEIIYFWFSLCWIKLVNRI